MHKLREMLDKRNTLITEARALVDKADTEKRNLTTEEKVRYDAIMKDATDLREKIDREQDLIAQEKAIAEEALRNHGANRDEHNPESKIQMKASRNLHFHRYR